MFIIIIIIIITVIILNHYQTVVTKIYFLKIALSGMKNMQHLSTFRCGELQEWVRFYVTAGFSNYDAADQILVPKLNTSIVVVRDDTL